MKRLLLPTKLSTSNSGKKGRNKGEATSPNIMNLLKGVKVLQQAIVDLLFDIMVECCQLSEGKKCNDAPEERSKTYLDCNETTTNRTTNGTVEAVSNLIDLRLGVGIDGAVGTRAVRSGDLSTTELVGKVTGFPAFSPPDSSAHEPSGLKHCNQMKKMKWPEQSDELLGLIINSLRKLDGEVLQGFLPPRRRPQSAHKIPLVLERAPKHLQLDLISLVPRLVDYSEHSLAAYALLDCLQQADTKLELRLPVLIKVENLNA